MTSYPLALARLQKGQMRENTTFARFVRSYVRTFVRCALFARSFGAHVSHVSRVSHVSHVRSVRYVSAKQAQRGIKDL